MKKKIFGKNKKIELKLFGAKAVQYLIFFYNLFFIQVNKILKLNFSFLIAL